jgi:hypothetical protein
VIVFTTLPIVAFCLLFLLFLENQAMNETGKVDWKATLIQTALFWSAFFALGTELLSLLHWLNHVAIILLWLSFVLCLCIIHWHFNTITNARKKLKEIFTHLHWGWFEYAIFFIILITLGILLITNLMSPPNIHDVLAYHMSRVMHWVQGQSLAFYPTSITWQLWMPPFSEFSQLHWQILTGGDVLASFHQWYYLVFIMVVVSATAELFGAKSRGQLLSALFILTVPIVVLQASGAKNDIVLSFFIAALMYYVVKSAISNLTFLDWVTCGISVGLGVLTKGTFSFFALPLLAWLLITILRKEGWRKAFAFAALGMLLVLVFNSGHWIRNTLTFGSPFTSEERRSLMNKYHGLNVTICNLSRHAVVQMNGKYGFINEAALNAVEGIHAWLEMPLFDPNLTHGPGEFYYVPTREEVVGAPLHFATTGLLFLMALIGLIKKEDRFIRITLAILSSAALAGMILFSAIFRWQAWSTRFFIPYYVMFAPVFGTIFGKVFPPIASWLTGMALVLVMINPLLNNYSRSFSWAEENRNSIWHLSRKGLLFANNTNIEGAVLELTHLMDISTCRTYGVIMRSNAPEYLLWASLTPHSGDYYLEHIAIDNVTTKHASSDFEPCGILLFEVTKNDQVDQSTYHLVKRWQLGEEYPFSLYLMSDYGIEGMD